MTTLITPSGQRAKRPLRVPIWLVLVLVLGGMTSIMALVIGVRFYVAGLSSADQLVKDLGRSGLAQLTETIESQLQPAADQARFLADILSRDQVDPMTINGSRTCCWDRLPPCASCAPSPMSASTGAWSGPASTTMAAATAPG